jgi:2-phospho-L-lactate guanylyltransferase
MTWSAQFCEPRHRTFSSSSTELSLPYDHLPTHRPYYRPVRWTVLIPAKSLPEAKSRLADSIEDPAAHGRLVLAIRADTISAAKRAPNVARVLAVVDRDGADVPGADVVLVQSEPGLNPALREAAAYAALSWPDDGVAALVGDLPALVPADLADALSLAALSPRAFVADADSTGTTLLTSVPGVALEPAFGQRSATRHVKIATALVGAPGLRQDVDTEMDLTRAIELGVGPETLAATASRSHCVHLD